MGNFISTNYASYNGVTVSVFDARLLESRGTSLKGKLTCVDCGARLKYVDKDGSESYFAHTSGKDGVAHKKHTKSGYLSSIVKRDFSSLGYNQLFLGGNIISKKDIKHIELNKKFTVNGEMGGIYTLRPDVYISTDTVDYMVEISNNRDVTSNKLNRYYLLSKGYNKDFKVIQISISDLDDLLNDTCFEYIEGMLLSRITDFSTYSVELDYRKIEKGENLLGVCWWCGTPLELSSNTGSNCFAKSVFSSPKIRSINLVDSNAEKYGERSELGGAYLTCPKCVENRHIAIHCPDCMSKNKLVPMKVLRNERTGKYFLSCSGYETARSVVNTGITSMCNCTLTVYNRDGVSYADEILAVGGIPNWLKLGSRSKKIRKLRGRSI